MFFRRQGPSGGYRSTVWLTEGLFVLQGLVGLLLVVGGNRPHDTLHWLYGVLLVLALPIAMGYNAGRAERQQSLIFGIVALFMAGLTIRALTTA